MKNIEFQKKVEEIDAKLELEAYERRRRSQIEMDIENAESGRNRARSITVGTAFGGTTELMMRMDGGKHIWCIMQPVEVVELIHQLAANVGCHIFIKPRQDFSSWRDWKITDEEKLHYNGHPPFVNDMADVQELGANMEAYEKEILRLREEGRGKPNAEFDEELKLKNKFIKKNNKDFMLGGAGGDGSAILRSQLIEEALQKKMEQENIKDTVPVKKSVNKQTTK